MNNYFKQIRNAIQNKSKDIMDENTNDNFQKIFENYNKFIDNSLYELLNNIKDNFITNKKKELLLLPYISKINEHIEFKRSNEKQLTTLFKNNSNNDNKNYDSDNEDAISDSDGEILSDDLVDMDKENDDKVQYKNFINNKIKELEKKYPNLYSTQYVQMAVLAWKNRDSR